MRRPRNVWDQKRGIWQPRINEEMVLREIVERLWWAKIPVYRINCPVGGKVRPNEAGIPDLMGWIPSTILDAEVMPRTTYSKPLFIEVKRPGGVRRPAQVRFIDGAKSDGCVAFFAESWDDVVKNFRLCGLEIKFDVGGKS